MRLGFALRGPAPAGTPAPYAAQLSAVRWPVWRVRGTVMIATNPEAPQLNRGTTPAYATPS